MPRREFWQNFVAQSLDVRLGLGGWYPGRRQHFHISMRVVAIAATMMRLPRRAHRHLMVCSLIVLVRLQRTRYDN